MACTQLLGVITVAIEFTRYTEHGLKRRGRVYNSMLFSIHEVCGLVYHILNSFQRSGYKMKNPRHAL